VYLNLLCIFLHVIYSVIPSGATYGLKKRIYSKPLGVADTEHAARDTIDLNERTRRFSPQVCTQFYVQ
jgi:hypothetical protein